MDGTLTETLRAALELVVDVGLHLLQLVAIFLVAAVVDRSLRPPVRRWMASALLPENAKTLTKNAVTFAIFLAAATMVLTVWGVSWSTLFTAIGVSTLVVALGLQSALQSLAAGIFVLFERPYNVGDDIRFTGHDVHGAVEEIGFRTTIIRSEEGERIVAPNALIFSQAVVNSSPDRTVLTIVNVRGAGESGTTLQETRAKVEAALVDVPGFTVRPQVVVRSRLAKFRVWRWIARIPRIGPAIERQVQRMIERTTGVRVLWSGSGGRETREDVVRRLEDLFPDASIRVRRL
jgi:small-conductance mechanosensitive channel